MGNGRNLSLGNEFHWGPQLQAEAQGAREQWEVVS
jgi:hypothetical protein